MIHDSSTEQVLFRQTYKFIIDCLLGLLRQFKFNGRYSKVTASEHCQNIAPNQLPLSCRALAPSTPCASLECWLTSMITEPFQ